MAEYIYSDQSDGILIIPTTVIKSNLDKFQEFIIDSNNENETEHIKLLNRDGVMHSAYPMHRHNSLWIHTYDLLHKPKSMIKHLNNSCFSPL